MKRTLILVLATLLNIVITIALINYRTFVTQISDDIMRRYTIRERPYDRVELVNINITPVRNGQHVWTEQITLRATPGKCLVKDSIYLDPNYEYNPGTPGGVGQPGFEILHQDHQSATVLVICVGTQGSHCSIKKARIIYAEKNYCFTPNTN